MNVYLIILYLYHLKANRKKDGYSLNKKNQNDNHVEIMTGNKIGVRSSNLSNSKFENHLFQILTIVIAYVIMSVLSFSITEWLFDFKIFSIPSIKIANDHPNHRLLTGITTSYGAIFGEYVTNQIAYNVHVTPDARYAVTVNYNGIFVYNITDQYYPTFLSYSFLNGGYPSFAMSSDGQTIGLFSGNTFRKVGFVNGVATLLSTKNMGAIVTRVCFGTNIIWVGTYTGIHALQFSDLTQLSLTALGQISGLIITADESMLYALRVSQGLYVYDISDPSSLVLKTSRTGSEFAQGIRALDLSPDENLLIIGDRLSFFDITDKNSPSLDHYYETTTNQAITISPDGKVLLTSGQTKGITAYDLTTSGYPVLGYLSTKSDVYDIKYIDDTTIIIACSDGIKIASLEPPPMKNVVPPLNFITRFAMSQHSIVVSSDGNYLYCGAQAGIFIYDISSDPHAPSLIRTISSVGFARSLFLSQDDKTLYMGGATLRIWDVTDPANPVAKVSFTTSPSVNIYDVECMSDNVCVLADIASMYSIVDCSDPTSPVLLVRKTGVFVGNHIMISNDEKYLGVYGKIIDITDRANPVQVATTLGFILAQSSNGKYAYICDTDFVIYDVTDWTKPILLSKIDIFDCIQILLNQDETIAYIAEESGGVKIISIADPYNPRQVNGYPMTRAYDLALSKDENTLYVADLTDGLTIFDVSVYIALNISQDHLIGSSTTEKVQIYQRIENKYRPFPYFFNVVKFGVISVIYSGTTILGNLPSWVTFYPLLGDLLISPNVPSAFGSYTLMLAISTAVPTTAFTGIGAITTDAESLELVGSLIDRGYLDINYYLTSAFDPDEAMILSSTYSADEPDYREVLTNYYHISYTLVNVYGSLLLNFINSTLNSPGMLNMTSLSSSSSTVKMTLYNGSYFISQKLPVLSIYSTDLTSVTLTGSITDIQNSMSLIRINLTHPDGCDGLVVIDDKMNPKITQYVKLISDYFLIHEPPSLISLPFEKNYTNVSIVRGTSKQFAAYFQDPNSAENTLTYSFYTITDGQINSINPDYLNMDASRGLLTATPTKDDCIFDNSESVYYRDITVVIVATNAGGLKAEYEFEMRIRNERPYQKISLQRQIDRYSLITGFAFTIKFDKGSVIDFSGDELIYTLSGESAEGIQFNKDDFTLEGTGPDEVGKVELTLTVSNGIQETIIYLNLDFKPSVSYYFNLLITYGGALLGIIGLYAYMSMIWNIICVKWYRYPKQYHIDAEVEINDTTIIPIAFVGDYLYLANEILKVIEKKLLRNAKGNKLTLADRYLIKSVPSKFDTKQLRQDIENISDITNETKLSIITELIKDKMALKLIQNSNRNTFSTFKALKKHWYDLIEFIPNNLENQTLYSLLGIQLKKESIFNFLPRSNKISPQDETNAKMIEKRMTNQNTHRDEDVQNNEELNMTSSKGLAEVPKQKKSEDSIESEHHTHSDINIGLLFDALLAYARTEQNINLEPRDVDISVKKVNPDNILPLIQKLFRFHLKEAGDDEDRCYGIETCLENKILKFKGTPTFDFPGQKVFIHMVQNLGFGKDFIRREIIIHGNKPQKKISPPADENMKVIPL